MTSQDKGQLSLQAFARTFPCRHEHGGCGAIPGEFCKTGPGKKSHFPHRDRRDQFPEQGEAAACSACGTPDEIGAYRHGWCRACTRRWYRAGRPEAGPPPLRPKYDRPARWRLLPTPLVERGVSRLATGIAAEHLVCADLLLQGYNAFMTDQTCPYDVAVDVGRLIRVQVKSTIAPRMACDRAANAVYKFSTKRSNKRPDYAEGAFELLALVALDVHLIAYLPTALAGHTAHIRQPGSQGGKQFSDFPFAKAIAELGLI